MSLKVAIFLNGQLHKEVVVTNDKEWIVGRAPNCDIQIDHLEVSRQHLKILVEDGVWKVRMLSRFGKILAAGTSVEEISVSSGSVIGVPPFEFRFQETSTEVREATSKIDIDEKTSVGAVVQKAVLVKLSSPEGSAVPEYTLSNETLSFGRSRQAGVQLNDSKASAKHFEIAFESGQYWIEDLQSSNGTFVNDQKLHNKQALRSGDCISVGDETFRFELRNPDFDSVQETSEDDSVGPDHTTQPNVIRLPVQRNSNLAAKPFERVFPNQAQGARIVPTRNNKFRGLVLVLAGILAYSLLDQKHGQVTQSSQDSKSVELGASNSSNPKLSPEQNKLLEDTYNLALSFAETGKYEQAAIEIQKILQLDQNYKKTKELQSKIELAIETNRQNDEIERQKGERNQLLVKVSQVLDGCESLLKNKKYQEVEPCTEQVNSLDPDNERAHQMVLSAKTALNQILESKKASLARSKARQSLESQFSRAESLADKKQYRKAILEYERLLDRFPSGVDPIKTRSSQRIRELRSLVQKESTQYLSEGKSAFDAKDYKTASTKLNRALEISPDNGEAKELLEKATAEVRTQMKNIYSESVFDESSGNIEGAKKKWQQIVDTDIPGNTYSEKAKLKLRKYTK